MSRPLGECTGSYCVKKRHINHFCGHTDCDRLLLSAQDSDKPPDFQRMVMDMRAKGLFLMWVICL